MGKNIYEKILSRSAGGRAINPGETMWLKPDLISLADGGWRSTLKLFEEIGLEKIADPDKVVGVIDHCTEQLAAQNTAQQVFVVRHHTRIRHSHNDLRQIRYR